MKDTLRVYSEHPDSAWRGDVVWDPVKSLWFLSHLGLALVVAPWLCSWSSVAVFVLLTGVTLCFGHSLGMHRLLMDNCI